METIKSVVKAIPFTVSVYRKARDIYWRSQVRSEADYTTVLKRKYRMIFGKTLNLDNPKSFNEKLQWTKLNDRDPRRTTYADKYAVREFVAERIGHDYLIPLLGVWDSAKEVDFDILPNQFVLKTNHGSGQSIIVKDKSRLNFNKARRQLNAWQKICLSRVPLLELHYANIPHKIIAEAYITDASNKDGQLYDYKFLCFNGKPHYCWVDVDRYTDHKRDVFDLNWELQPWTICYKHSNRSIPKPEQLDLMVSLAGKLADNFPHVRVDFYNVNGKIYFGEMTFTSEGGFGKFSPQEYDEIIGALWDIDMKDKGENKNNGSYKNK